MPMNKLWPVLKSFGLLIVIPGSIGSGLAYYELQRRNQPKPPPPPVAENVNPHRFMERPTIFTRLDSPVVLVEFGDLECPACSMVHPLVEDLVEKHQLGYIFRNFPLETIHKRARPFALNLLAHPPETRYRELSRFLSSPSQDRPKEIPKLDAKKLANVKADLENDIALAKSLNLHATPTFFVYADGKVWRLARVSQVESFLKRK